MWILPSKFVGKTFGTMQVYHKVPSLDLLQWEGRWVRKRGQLQLCLPHLGGGASKAKKKICGFPVSSYKNLGRVGRF